MLPLLWRECRRIAWSWWRVDRLRIAESQGRLLRIAPPARLLVCGALLQVHARRVRTGTDGPWVVYDGFCDGQACELHVLAAPIDAPPQVRWRCDGTETLAFEDDVEILLEDDRI